MRSAIRVRLIGTPGQRNDIALAHELVDGIEAGANRPTRVTTLIICATAIAESGAEIVIPPKRNRKDTARL